ncbi:hypothetical protein G9A89_023081 [Geosiphon pyriformis]|nr:hypothetical protein G9A89_023081 [Geosiphon pyriformis]
MENKSFTAIFLFEIEELSATSLFSEAVLEEKPITTIYTNTKVDGHAIKLILNSESVDSIITRQLMNQLVHAVVTMRNTRWQLSSIATYALLNALEDQNE